MNDLDYQEEILNKIFDKIIEKGGNNDLNFIDTAALDMSNEIFGRIANIEENCSKSTLIRKRYFFNSNFNKTKDNVLSGKTLLNYFEVHRDENKTLAQIRPQNEPTWAFFAVYLGFFGWQGYKDQLTVEQGVKEYKDDKSDDKQGLKIGATPKIILEAKSNLLKDLVQGSKQFFDGNYSHYTISDNLLTDWSDENEIDSNVLLNKKEELSLITSIENLWAENIRNSLIVGEGGMGKTFSLLRIWKHYISKDSTDNPIPIFIQLNNYNIEENKKSFIIKYIVNNYLNQRNLDETLENDLWRLFSLRKDPVKPQFILLLDGLNEIYKDQIDLRKDLDNWWLTKTDNVQIIITSRHDIRLNYLWHNLHLIKLLPLSNKKIQMYLDLYQIDFKGKKVPWGILNNPMMLTLFTSSDELIKKYGGYSYFAFIESFSTQGELLWNYFECQLTTYFETHKYDEKQFFYWMFLVKVLTPFLGYEMERQGFYNISENTLAELINKGNRVFFYKKFTQAFPYYRKHLKYFNLGKLNFENEDERIEIIKEILIEKLRIIVKDNESYRFSHQNFLDFTASIHVINEIKISAIANTLPQSLKKRTLPNYIRKYIGEIKGEQYYESKGKTEIESLLDSVKGNFNGEELGYFNWNIIEILYDFRNNLAKIDLSNLDLSKIVLKDKMLYLNEEGKITGANFNRSKLFSENFASQGHPTPILKFFELKDENKLISISSTYILSWDLNNDINIATIIKFTYPQRIADVFHNTESKKILYVTERKGVYELDIKTMKTKKAHKQLHTIFGLQKFNSKGTHLLSFRVSKEYYFSFTDIDLTTKNLLGVSFEAKDFDHEYVTDIDYIDESEKIIVVGFTNGSICFISLLKKCIIVKYKIGNESINGIQVKKRAGIIFLGLSTGLKVIIAQIKSINEKSLDFNTVSFKKTKNIEISCLSFNNKWNNFLVGFSNGQFFEYSTDSRRVISAYNMYNSNIVALKYSEEETTLVSGDSAGMIKIWNSSNQQYIRTLGTERISSAHCYSRNKKYLFYSPATGIIVRWDFQQDKKTEWNVYREEVTAIDSTPLEDNIVVGFKDETIIQYTYNLRKVNRINKTININGDIKFSEDSGKICIYNFDNEFLVYDLDKEKIIKNDRLKKPEFNYFSFDEESNLLLTLYNSSILSNKRENYLCYLRLDNLKWEYQSIAGIKGYKFHFSEDGSKLLSYYSPDELIEISTSTGKQINTLILEKALNVNQIKYNYNGSKICGLSDNNVFYIYDLVRNNELVTTIKCKENDEIKFFYLTYDNYLFQLYESGNLFFQRLLSSRVHQISFITKRIDRFCVVPNDSSILISCSSKRSRRSRVDRLVKWDYKNNKICYERKLDAKYPMIDKFTSIRAVKVSPNGSSFITMLFNEACLLWDIKTGKIIKPLSDGELGVIKYLSVSPDGKSVLAQFDKNNVFKEFDLKSGECLGINKLKYFNAQNVYLTKSERKPAFDAKKLFKNGELDSWYTYYSRDYYYSGLFVRNCSFLKLHKDSDLELDLKGLLNFKGAKINIRWKKVYYKIDVFIKSTLSPIFGLLMNIVLFIPDRIFYSQFVKYSFDRMRQKKSSNPFVPKKNDE